MKPVKTLAMALIAFVMWGCDDPRPRELPFPVLDTARPFPELTASRKGPRAGSTDFERAISSAFGDEDEAGETNVVSVQSVPLGARLVGDVPMRFDEWEWSTDGNITVITHSAPGLAPDALIYVEVFGSMMRKFPSVETVRFQRSVDTSTPSGLANMASMAGSALAKAGVDHPDLPDLGQLFETLDMATSPTMGLGIGYRSAPKSFTGWRWVGHNDHSIALRLGRSSGVWGPQDQPTQRTQQFMNKIGTLIPELEGLDEQYASLASRPAPGPAQPGGAMPIRPAYMLFGNAASKQERSHDGVHIAVICEQAPTCPVARELSDFLASIRVPEHGAVDRSSATNPDLTGFMSSVGIQMMPAEDVLSPDKLESFLRELDF